MVTDKRLKEHINKVVYNYFNDIPSKAIPQLYLEKMYQAHTNVIMLKKYNEYSDKWISFDPQQSVIEWYRAIRDNICVVLEKYVIEMNKYLPRELLSELLWIDNLISLLSWVMYNEAKRY